MNRRKLGNTGLVVGPLVFGGNVFGWTVQEKTAFELLDAFVDAGFSLIDTADVYSNWVPGNEGGESETIIGNWLKHSGKRDKVIIITKVGMEMTATQKGLSKKHILNSIDGSLKRLQCDYVDIYLSHRDDPNTPQHETLEAHAQLVKQGKVRIIGASNYTAPRLSEALNISAASDFPAYQLLEPRYNLYSRDEYEGEVQKLCIEHDLGVIAYASLASGFLTGKYRNESDFSKSPRGAGIKSRYFNSAGLNLLKVMDEVAAECKATLPQIALAWLMAKPGVTAPIASATSLQQLKEIMKAAELKLEASAINKLDNALQQPAK